MSSRRGLMGFTVNIYSCFLVLSQYVRPSRLLSSLFCFLLFFFIQALWLTAAYYLEFEGMNTFVFVWLAGVVFFIVNIVILNQLVQHYQRKPLVNKSE